VKQQNGQTGDAQWVAVLARFSQRFTTPIEINSRPRIPAIGRKWIQKKGQGGVTPSTGWGWRGVKFKPESISSALSHQVPQ